MNPTVIIIGAGLTGLTAALRLEKLNINYKILEASSSPGGRVKTDLIEGFKIDRGFQVFFDCYQTPKTLGLLPDLQLQRFDSGAYIGMHKIGNPIKLPQLTLSTVTCPYFSTIDKAIIFRLMVQSLFHTRSLDAKNDRSTMTLLREEGVSQNAIESFFRPFFGGVFLDPTLSTSSKFFDFTFRNFVLGNACLPKDGMQALPNLIASKIPQSKICFTTTVASLAGNTITLDSGETLKSDTILVCTDASHAATLLNISTPFISSFKETTCLHFVASKAPFKEKMIYLNPIASDIILHFAPLTNINSSYSPDKRALISVTLNSQTEMNYSNKNERVMMELRNILGNQVNEWKLLDQKTIKEAHPVQTPGMLTPWNRTHALTQHIFIGGDYTENASIEGAMSAGEKLAEMVRLKQL